MKRGGSFTCASYCAVLTDIMYCITVAVESVAGEIYQHVCLYILCVYVLCKAYELGTSSLIEYLAAANGCAE